MIIDREAAHGRELWQWLSISPYVLVPNRIGFSGIALKAVGIPDARGTDVAARWQGPDVRRYASFSRPAA